MLIPLIFLFFIFSNGCRPPPFPRSNPNPLIIGLRGITRGDIKNEEIFRKIIGLKLFNHNFNFRDRRHTRALINGVRITSAKGTHFMKAFINERHDQIAIGSRDCQST